jgi:hypothetical protein
MHAMKPRLNSREIECLVTMHKGGALPPDLRKVITGSLLGKELICAGERGWVLTKKVVRYLTGVV